MRIGEFIANSRPELAAGRSPDDVERIIRSSLQDPARRPHIIRWTREALGDTQRTDDEFGSILEQKLGVSTPAPQPAGGEQEMARDIVERSTPEEAKQARTTGKIEQAEQLWRRQGRNAAVALDPDNAGIVGPGTVARAKSLRREVPSLESVDPETGLPVGFPVAENMADLQKRFPGAKLQARGTANGAFATYMTAVDDDGVPVAVLDPHAGFKVEDTEGLPLLAMSGGGSVVQRGVAGAARAPLKAALGDRLPDSGPGYRELAADVGQVAGEAAPAIGNALGALGGAAAAGFRRVQAADPTAWMWEKVANASDAVRGAVGSESKSDLARQWAEEGRAEDERQLREAQGLWEGAKHAASLAAGGGTEEERALSGGQYMRGAGQEAGEWASILTPNEYDLIVPGAKLAKKAAEGVGFHALAMAPAAVVPALAKIDKAKRRKWVETTEPVRNWLTNTPWLAALRDKEKEVNKAVWAARGTGGETFERKFLEDKIAKVESIFAKHPQEVEAAVQGYGDATKAKEAFLRDALDLFTTPQDRMSASPLVKDLIDEAQLWNHEVYKIGKDAGFIKQEYNPYHPYYGRDPTRKAMHVESQIGQEKVENNLPVDVFPRIHPDAPGGLYSENFIGPRQANRPPSPIPGIEKLRQLGIEGSTREARPVRSQGDLEGRFTAAVRNLKPKMSEAEGRFLEEDLKGVSLLTGMARSARAAAERAGIGNQAAAEELSLHLPRLMQDMPNRYIPPQTFIQQFGIDPRLVGRSAYADVRQGDQLMKSTAAKHLIDNDLVVIHVKGEEPFAAGRVPFHNELKVDLPKQFSQLDGMVVDRYMARALEDLSMPISERTSFKAKMAVKAVDNLLGMGQIQRMITFGNMGFNARNRFSELMRIGLDESSIFSNSKDRKLLQNLVGEVSNAPIGAGRGRTLGAEYGKLAGMTTGELHEDMLRQVGVGRGASAELENMVRESPGAGKLLSMVGLEKPVNAIANTMMKPGEATGEAAEYVFRSAYPQLNRSYGAEDGAKMMSYLAKRKRGINRQVAADEVKRLLIDYTDKSAVEEALKGVFPFIKWTTGSIQGAFDIARKNPRGFTRVADLSRALEANDQAVWGSGVDPALKPDSEQLALNPMVRDQRGALKVMRLEHPFAEGASTLTSAPGSPFTDERTAARSMHPLWSNLYASYSGRDPSTLKSIFGLNEAEMLSAKAPGLLGMLPGATPISQWSRARDLGLDSGSYANLLYSTLRYAPLVGGRLMSPQADIAGRSAAGLGAPPAWRGDVDNAAAVERSALAAALGLRQAGVEGAQQTVLKLLQHEVPTNDVEFLAKRKKKGNY